MKGVTLLAGGLGALGARAAYRTATRLPEPARRPWARTNHAGRPVTLLEGPAFVAGAALGALPAGAPGVVAALGSGLVGALDDLGGDAGSKGLRGHLSAAARGEITTGAVKIAGLDATGVLAAALVQDGRGPSRAARALLGGAVVAASANLINLFDLRPGRALKVTLLGGIPLVLPTPARGAATAAAAVGAAGALLGPDLRGESMLGDTGANPAGALLGLALVQRLGPRGQLAALGALTALTLASERVSFTRVIEATPVLRDLDRWGRS